MSTAQLQRVSVRMLYDPAFVASVYDDPARALDGLDVSPAERELLVKSDRRVWGADPLRRRRSLKALLDEFKASSALAVAKTRRLATVDGFFSSSRFHACIQRRGSMAAAFGDYLESLQIEEPRLAPVAKLEAAMARARRGHRPPKATGRLHPGESYVLSTHCEPVLLPGGTLEVVHAIERVLFEITLAPVAAFADDGPDLSGVPGLGAIDACALIIERAEGDDSLNLAEATADLVRLLEVARAPVRGVALVTAAIALGAEADEANLVVQPLLDDGLITLAS